jgi:putative sugar O-methyltransferase
VVDQTITTAIEHHAAAIALPLPQGFLVSPWWAAKQEQLVALANTFNTSQDCIVYAQQGGRSGFDHRKMVIDVHAVDIIIKQFEEIAKEFPGFDLERSNLRESVYSIPSSLYPWKGRQLSTIFFWHVYQYLAVITRLCAKPARIVEIGGGYGALARLFKLEHPNVHYTITDIPESLFFAEVFLKENFPNCSVRFATTRDEIEKNQQCDFLLVPVQASAHLKNYQFDVAINTGSLQEMPDVTVDYWMDFVQSDLIDSFYSLNYFLNQIDMNIHHAEVSNFLCPKLDSYWRVVHWVFDPPTITINTDKHWLGIACVREAKKIRNPAEKKALAKLYLMDSAGFGRGSMQWLMTLQNAHRLDASVETLWPLFDYTKEIRVRESVAYGRALQLRMAELSPEQQAVVTSYLQTLGV